MTSFHCSKGTPGVRAALDSPVGTKLANGSDGLNRSDDMSGCQHQAHSTVYEFMVLDIGPPESAPSTTQIGPRKWTEHLPGAGARLA